MKLWRHSLKAFLLISTTLLLMSITSVFGNTDSTGANRELRGQSTFYQEQYTPQVLEPTTVKQVQSVRVNPELSLLSKENVVYVDSIISKNVKGFMTFLASKNEEIKKETQREAKAYLIAFLAVFVISGIGFFVGNRLENNSIIIFSMALVVINTYFVLLKIPTLISVL